MPETFVLIHGAWHTGEDFEPIANILLWTYEDYVLDDFVQTHAGYHDAENFENPARAEDQRNEVRLAFGVVWFRS